MKLILLIALAACVAANDNHYDTKYDNLDVDTLTNNDRLLHAYAHCFIGDAKCTPEGNDIRKWIPEGSRSACAKCTEKQKVVVAKFIKAIQKKLPKEWEILSKQGDPEGKYTADLQKFIDEYVDKSTTVNE